MAFIYKVCETFYPFKISILYSRSNYPGYDSFGCCDAQQQKNEKQNITKKYPDVPVLELKSNVTFASKKSCAVQKVIL